MKKHLLFYLLLSFLFLHLKGQQIPSKLENIAYLSTFAKDAPKLWGDDDNTQIFFFVIPTTCDKPVYFKIYDPDCNGELDTPNREYNSSFKFSLYGGKGAFSNKASHSTEPNKHYKSGTLLETKTFKPNDKITYEKQWYTLDPIDKYQGEYVKDLGGYVFKMICEGLTGNDGNLYKYEISSSATKSKAIDGANAFTYEYSFRLDGKPGSVTHVYPFIDNNVVSITQNNFDFDKDGEILLYSVSKNRHVAEASSNSKWADSKHLIEEKEKGSTIDIQILKKSNANNDMVIYILNQYNDPVPFFAIPIGGTPTYQSPGRISVYASGK